MTASRLAGGPISVARTTPLERVARFSSQVSLEANWKTVRTGSWAAVAVAARDEARAIDGRMMNAEKKQFLDELDGHF